jgi:ligand-binding sensor domain-containing protein/two-component sensor histidine kinase
MKLTYTLGCCRLIIACVLLLHGLNSGIAQNEQFNFRQLSLEEGLSQATVNCMLQDSEGYLWVGTNSGLNRYDGYGFKVFRHDPGELNSLSSNYVLSLCEDSQGNIWIGTMKGGLNKFNRKTHEFQHFEHQKSKASSLSHNDVSVIFEDDQHVLWIGTLGGGLSKFFDDSGQFKRYTTGAGEGSLSSNYVTKIEEDENGALWIGTVYGGLNMFDRFTERFTQFVNDVDDPTSLSSNNVKDLHIDRSGDMWVATDNGLNLYNQIENQFVRFGAYDKGLSSSFVNVIFEDDHGILWVGTQNGLNVYDVGGNYFKGYHKDENDRFTISSNNILSMIQDRTGNLWIGTDEGGINILDYHSRKFSNYRHQANRESSLLGNNVRTFSEDSVGNIWVGTRGGGLNKFSKDLAFIKSFVPKHRSSNALNSPNVMAIRADAEGNLWVATQGNGINKFDPKTEQFTNVGNDISYGAISSMDVLSLHIDKEGIVWAGTVRGGLNRFDPKTKVWKTFASERDNLQTISDDNVSTIFEDSQGDMWIGTFNGFNKFDRETETFQRFMSDQEDPTKISQNYVKSIFEDSQGFIWIGTTGGLNRYDSQTGEFEYWLIRDGLPNEVIYGIIEDAKGQLWISTNKGISCFDRAADKFRNYTTSDGLQGNEFNTGASLEASDGRILFGGLNGFNAFYPDSITNNNYEPPIVLTGFSIFNSEVQLEDGVLDMDISETYEVELRSDQTVFSIEFAALNFTAAPKNEFAYKLVGFQDNWSYVGNRRFVTFTNLDPGEYLFVVKGSNNDGLWNEDGRSLRIIIKPALWQTQWFRAILVFGALFIIFLVVKVREHNMKVQKLRLEEIVQERTSEIRKEKEAKEVLLKEIHHRVKNNLQVITSLLRLQSYHVEDEKMLSLFSESQNRIVSMALIHEKIYESKDLAHIDLSEYVEQLTENLIQTYSLAQEITLDIDVRVNSLSLDILTPIGLILNELISNAVKYGFEDRDTGVITVHLDRVTKDKYRMIVGDNGVGLPDKMWTEEEPQTFGLELVRALSEQVDGELIRLDREGTFFELIFCEKTSPEVN